MDDRTARGREDVSREQRAPAPEHADRPSTNGRVTSAVDSPTGARSASTKPALTEREREERWPLG